MRRKPTDAHETMRLKKLVSADGSKLSQKIPKSLEGQVKKGGESIFETALKQATPEQVTRAELVTGPLDVSFCIRSYHRTRNPLWLWFGLSQLTRPEDIPSEIFKYLKEAAGTFVEGILDQVKALERVQITPDREVQEGVAHLPAEPPSSPDTAAVLGLSQPGRNPFQALARDLQTASMTVAIEDLIRRTGCSQEQAYTALAIALGRSSPEAGPSTEAVRKIVGRGRKLLFSSHGKPPSDSSFRRKN